MVNKKPRIWYQCVLKDKRLEGGDIEHEKQESYMKGEKRKMNNLFMDWLDPSLIEFTMEKSFCKTRAFFTCS